MTELRFSLQLYELEKISYNLLIDGIEKRKTLTAVKQELLFLSERWSTLCDYADGKRISMPLYFNESEAIGNNLRFLYELVSFREKYDSSALPAHIKPARIPHNPVIYTSVYKFVLAILESMPFELKEYDAKSLSKGEFATSLVSKVLAIVEQAQWQRHYQEFAMSDYEMFHEIDFHVRNWVRETVT
jgi:hypothetical protein